MKKHYLISLLTSFVLTGCTYNISMSHTSGGSTDTIEDTATNTPTTTPTLNIPITPNLPSLK